MRTWTEREELVEARGAEYRAGVMTEDQFRAYLFSMRYRGEDIRHRMQDFTPAPIMPDFEERELDVSRQWLRDIMVKIKPFNDDGVSLKGCQYIYGPKGQAGEYAPLAANAYRGCGHGCAYCYVPPVTKQPRPEFDAGAVLRGNYLGCLEKDAIEYQRAGSRQQVMMSFTTDPYHPGENIATRDAIDILQHYGLGVCTLTKGGSRALRDIDKFRPYHDAFACTLTTLDPAFSLKWERNAALPRDRIDTLKRFHERDIFTWVSLEPTLDVEHSLAIVDATCAFVDLYKVGRANYLKEITTTTDWRDYTLRMLDLLGRRGRKFYFKKDLQPYLPAGTVNPLRVQQHR